METCNADYILAADVESLSPSANSRKSCCITDYNSVIKRLQFINTTHPLPLEISRGIIYMAQFLIREHLTHLTNLHSQSNTQDQRVGVCICAHVSVCNLPIVVMTVPAKKKAELRSHRLLWLLKVPAGFTPDRIAATTCCKGENWLSVLQFLLLLHWWSH